MGKKELEPKPTVYYEGKYSLEDLRELKKKEDIWKVIDIYENQLIELFEIIYPKINKTSREYKKKLQSFIKRKTSSSKKILGNWIYYPWNGYLVHTVNEKDYFLLRTNRNRNLITELEQEKLSGFITGIVGLSVGNNVALGLAYQGISNSIKLAERDTLETTNLNRMRAGVYQIGNPKLTLSMQQIYEINPYAEIYPFGGLTEGNIGNFFTSKPKLDLIFDEIDDFKMKVLIRVHAKKYKLPVIMLTNLGDKVMADVERYDLVKNLELFNGVDKEMHKKIISKKVIAKEDEKRFAIGIAGARNIPKRAIESVKEIGHTLVGRPQLASTVSVSGGIGAYLARKIALKGKLESGRYILDLDKVFIK